MTTLIAIFYLQSQYREPLFERSLYMIEHMQRAGRSQLLTVLTKAVSLFLGGEILMVSTYVICQAIGRPERTLYYLIMMLVNVWFTMFVKLILHNPRPYMVVDDQIRVMGTPSEFGDPSGHTMSSA